MTDSTLQIKNQTVRMFEEYYTLTDESEKIFLENDIIDLNRNFALHKASQYRYTSLDEDDLEAIAMVGLMIAVRTYDSSKAQFSTYANRVIENEINDALRKASRKKNTKLNPISLDQEIANSNLTRIDMVVDGQVNIEGDLINEIQHTGLLEVCQTILNEMEWIVLQNFLSTSDSRISQSDLGVLLESSQTTISRIEKRAVRKLRDFLTHQEWGLDILR